MQLKQELKPGLKQEQWMKLQTMQFMKILQIPTLELHQIIQHELEQNPLLELKEKKEETIEEIDSQEENESEEFSSFPDEERKSISKIIEDSSTESKSLYEHLIEQLSLEVNDFEKLKIGEFLIGNIDQKGYLQISVQDTAHSLAVNPEAVEDTLKIIQSFDPPGVGARNLSECLLLQLKSLHLDNEYIKLAQQVLENYLEDLSKGKFNKIAKNLNVREKIIKDINKKITSLNPYPGSIYSKSKFENIIPDIIVKAEDGDYEVLVNNDFVPQIRINPLYKKILQEKEPSAKKYLREKMNSALLLIKSINQRQQLLYKISLSLVNIQKDFLDKGISYLKPLTMEEMAKIQNVSPSTISRAIMNKYIQTPRGVFPFKFFFSSSINKGTISSNSVKDRLNSLIENEDKSNPLSDLDIVKKLKEEGFNLSRRAVTKYRQSLGIPSTFKRRVNRG